MTGVAMPVALARPQMSLLNGGIAGAIVAAATGTAGVTSSSDAAVKVALITVFGGLLTALATAVIGPLVASRMRGRRKDAADLADRLVDQLEERNAEIARLHAELAEVRRTGRRRP